MPSSAGNPAPDDQDPLGTSTIVGLVFAAVCRDGEALATGLGRSSAVQIPEALQAMKTLILIRHAKSSWKDHSLPDHERPLSKRGKRDAPTMGRRLAERGIEVELMLSSPATRAMATAEAVAEEIGCPWDEIVADERLYEADTEELLTVVEDQDDWVDCLLLVGHNPGLTALVNYLSRVDIDNLPTCGVVDLRYDVTRWAEIAAAEPLQCVLDYPRKKRRPKPLWTP